MANKQLQKKTSVTIRCVGMIGDTYPDSGGSRKKNMGKCSEGDSEWRDNLHDL
jgi:hypothetical protein